MFVSLLRHGIWSNLCVANWLLLVIAGKPASQIVAAEDILDPDVPIELYFRPALKASRVKTEPLEVLCLKLGVSHDIA